MFSKPIFKQSVRTNGILWLVITLVASALLSNFIIRFDPEDFSALSVAAEGTQFGAIFSGFGTILGTLETFYKMVAILLGLVYIIFSANNLVVNEVDSGSMAYTLSTPIKRSTVIFTKMAYMVGSIILMFIVLAGVGMGVSELVHHNITGSPITEDVEAAADAMDRNSSYVRDHLYMIKDDEYAMRSGAEARSMDTEAYSQYLDQAILRDSYKAAAAELTKDRKEKYKDDDDMDKDDIEITEEELAMDPSMILNNNDALSAGAKVTGQSLNDYRAFIGKKAAEMTDGKEAHDTKSDESSQLPADASMILSIAAKAGAEAIDTTETNIQDNMSLLKGDAALKAGAEAANVSEDQLKDLINSSMVNAALKSDNAMSFDIETFIWLNVGACLLILAMGSISFFASTVFNRSNQAMILGAGLPFAFFLISMVIEQSDSLENLKYFSLTTLFKTDEILSNGDFGIPLLILGGIAAVLFAISNVIFCRKDLPL
ncbi:ABC transporter permease subunit [Carnobacterium sp.]|uniref:ABC transporter permease subunit n=1 Tax=Carnobacterium sp. TaxID=48221 RepID=UPI0028AEF354|nr:ABC transporter permease subunit [Carnobacterium sp.]